MKDSKEILKGQESVMGGGSHRPKGVSLLIISC